MPEVEVREKRAPTISVDGHVLWFCAAMACFIAGAMLGEQLQQARAAAACPVKLRDGRALVSFHLGAKGPERCVYEWGKS